MIDREGTVNKLKGPVGDELLPGKWCLVLAHLDLRFVITIL